MRRRMIWGVALLGVLAAVPAVTVGAMAAGASRPAATVTFTGSITCTVKGSITATPPITLSKASHKLVFKAALSGCTGNTSQGGVTITAGHLTATTTVTASCTSLSGGSPAGTVTWTANTPGATATKQSFSNASVAVNGGIITATLPGSGGTATATGSFAGTSSVAKAIVDQTESSLAGACFGSGVSKLTFTGKHGASTITVA